MEAEVLNGKNLIASLQSQGDDEVCNRRVSLIPPGFEYKSAGTSAKKRQVGFDHSD